MATITSYTAERAKALEDSNVVDGDVDDGHLILRRFDESTIDAGEVTSQEARNSRIISGEVVGDDLILTRMDNTPINAGKVRGDKGIKGPPGDVTEEELEDAIEALEASTISGITVSNTTNWTTTNVVVRKVGNIVDIFFTVERTSGGGVSNPKLVVATLSIEARFSRSQPVSTRMINNNISVSSAMFMSYNPSNGEISLWHNGGTYSQNQLASYHGRFIVD